MGELPAVTDMAALRARPVRDHEAHAWFFDPQFGRAAVKVLPGEYFVYDQDVAVTTTLGSCVAVCLHDPGSGIGGMNHFMLPDAGPEPRFGPYAMDLLVQQMLRQGAHRDSMVAKVFGGGQVMQSLASTLIGEKNVAFAKDYLARERIPVLGQDVLDVHPRKVCLFPRSGTVLCRRLPAAVLPEVDG